MSKTKNESIFSEEEMKEMVLNRLGERTGDEKTPSFLTVEQMEEIEEEMSFWWGEEGGYVVHEITSEYVHTDVASFGKRDGPKTFATFGMCSRKMAVPENAPDWCGRRIELVMRASPDVQIEIDEKKESKGIGEAAFACDELGRTSKYPFRERTWLGPFHTINASDEFKERFGYSYYLFIPYKETEIRGLGRVDFLQLIPVYEEERDWMASRPNGSLLFLQAYPDTLGDDQDLLGWIDRPRDVILPED